MITAVTLPRMEQPEPASAAEIPGFKAYSGIERWIGWAGCLAVAACLGWLGMRAQGVGLHDELGHLLVARDAWHTPRLIFSSWGRTVNTLLYMPVAGAPLAAARLWAALMFALSALLAWRLAQRERVALACLVPWLMLAQRWMLESGWMALTLPPFALLAMLAATAGRAGRWRLAGLLVGMLPLVRHEAVVLCAALGALMLARRQWMAAILVGLPLALNELLAWGLFGDHPLAVFFEPQGTRIYGSGGALRFIVGIFLGCGPLVFLLALAGAVQLLQRRALCALVLFGALYAATHVVLFSLGSFSTAGFVVFLTPLIPLLAILAAEGLHWLGREASRNLRRGWRLSPAFASRLRVLILGGLGLLMLLGVQDIQFPGVQAHELAINEAIAFLRGRGLGSQPVVACHVWFFYHMPRPIPRTDRLLWINEKDPASFRPGTLVLWEAYYSESWRLTRKALEGPQFQRIWAAANGQAALYRKLF